ncbi:MAG TPA: discoidin domain-containing protein [Planctomycetota bacterium]|nr:discoidin domain-containing protein [Planctomycetota bacterium]
MLIFYCEQCSQRVKQEDIASGRAVKTSETGVLCAACSPKKADASAGTSPKLQRTSGANPILGTAPRRSVNAPSRKEPAPAPTTAHAKGAPQKQSSSTAVLGLAGLGIMLMIAGIYLTMRKKETPQAAGSGTAAVTTAAIAAPAVKTEAPVKAPEKPPVQPVAEKAAAPAVAPASANAESSPAQALAERQKQAEKEMEDLRTQRATKLLEEHKAAFARNAIGPFIYQTKLRQIASTYRSTAAAAEAEKLMAELKIPAAISGRFVRIENTGENRILSLAEVQIFSGGKNIATGGKATQSSQYEHGAAPLAIDGNTDGAYDRRSVTHTQGENSPWWEVDLQNDAEIQAITVFNRHECSDRLQGFKVQILNASHGLVWETVVAQIPNPSVTVEPGR